VSTSETFIGIDIGGTKCAVLAGDRDGAVIEKRRFATLPGPSANVDQFQHHIEEYLAQHATPKSIGISCGGPLDAGLGIIHSPPNLPGWDDVPIKAALENRFGIPVFLQNDANACALAEHRFGAGVGSRNMIFLTFGTGLGAGIILDGKLYEGTNGMAGEVGHIRLASDGPVGYGKPGSFEGFCSGGGIAQLAQTFVREYQQRGEHVGFVPKGGIDAITARTVGEAAANGNECARAILRSSGKWLGKGLSILIDVLNPEVIVIGSIFARSRDYLQPAAEAVIRSEALSHSASVCRLLPAELGERIGDVAALSVAMSGAGV
jgi:glucokinase